MNDIKSEVLAYIEGNGYTPLLPNELAKALNLPKKEYKSFTALLKSMEQDGELVFSKKGKIMTLESCNLMGGKYSSSERGFGFVTADKDTGVGDIFIPSRFSFGAMHGDRVLVRILAKNIGNQKSEGEIVRVVSRNTKTITGTFEKGKGHGFVIPDNRRYCSDIYVANKDSMKANDGDKVKVTIKKYPQGGRCAEGVVTHVFGAGESREANYLSVLCDFGIETEFPQEVSAQARAYGTEINPDDLAGRLDLREETIFTIDSGDAKDFDDAISLKVLENGNFLLGVHIADVSHYVTENSPLDKEAMRRGTSIYFVDKVVPMLPVELSNGICSLNPKVDRLTLSCIMQIDKDGNVVSYEIKKSVIRSCERLTYADVTAVIEETSLELAKKYDYLADTFLLMAKLAAILRKKRIDRGSLEFEIPESKVIMDESGHPVDVVRRERGVSDKLIEEFMLVANETVAKHACNRELPFVFRIHETPDPEKVQNFSSTAALLGHPLLLGKEGITPMAMQRVLMAIKGTPQERVLSTLMLRSMMKAKYAPHNLGHFGLAAKYYCHFTSPIRRYPDLSIHRILSESLEHPLSEKRLRELIKFCEISSAASSDAELNAVEVEREIEDLYMAIYMKDHIGEVFEGVISSVTSFGIFVELPNAIEGLVSINSLDDDFYDYDEAAMSLRGVRGGRVFKLGDVVSVKVAAADIISRNIDFVLEETK